MTKALTANHLQNAGALEEVGPRSYQGPLAYYAFLRIGGQVYAPVSATRRVDGYLNEPGVFDVKVLTWAGPRYVVAFRRPDGTDIDDLAEVVSRCRQYRVGRLLVTLALAVFPGILLTPLGTAVIAGYGLVRFWKRGKHLNQLREVL